MDSGAYSTLDRFLHRMAFGGVELQKAVADVEDRLHARALAGVTLQSPVFICSLPRAGTTLLLETIAALPGSAAHTYRDMPFLLCPLLWNGISRPFRTAGATRARAHGDGMEVGFDSPEAFEEALWRAFWPGKYAGAQISLWHAADDEPEFEDFFRNHMRKIVLAKAGGVGRYVSKNNANIARIRFLRRLFPSAVILVPFRDPIDQAVSLLTQHRRFSALHARDAFAREYMESIGHLEFGAALKPIAFPHAVVSDPAILEFWLGYWVAAFQWLVEQPVHFIDFDRLCAAPGASLEALGALLGQSQALSAQAGRFRQAPSYAVGDGVLKSPVARAARGLHERLRPLAINAGC